MIDRGPILTVFAIGFLLATVQACFSQPTLAPQVAPAPPAPASPSPAPHAGRIRRRPVPCRQRSVFQGRRAGDPRQDRARHRSPDRRSHRRSILGHPVDAAADYRTCREVLSPFRGAAFSSEDAGPEPRCSHWHLYRDQQCGRARRRSGRLPDLPRAGRPSQQEHHVQGVARAKPRPSMSNRRRPLQTIRSGPTIRQPASTSRPVRERNPAIRSIPFMSKGSPRRLTSATRFWNMTTSVTGKALAFYRTALQMPGGQPASCSFGHLSLELEAEIAGRCHGGLWHPGELQPGGKQAVGAAAVQAWYHAIPRRSEYYRAVPDVAKPDRDTDDAAKFLHRRGRPHVQYRGRYRSRAAFGLAGAIS